MPVALAHDNFTNFRIYFFRSLGDIRDLVGRISQAAKDRDESLHQVASLKRQNDQLLENTVGLEEKLSTQKKKSRSFEDQLRKVELKVAHSDANLADQVIKQFLEKKTIFSHAIHSCDVYLRYGLHTDRF